MESLVFYKRGDIVFVEREGKVLKVMVCEFILEKKRVKVVVNVKERFVLMEIFNFYELMF